MRFQSRLSKLEEYEHRRTPAHLTSVVRVPADIEEADWRAWLAEQPCACGQVRCPERRVGMVVSEPLTPEAWVAAFEELRELHGQVHGGRGRGSDAAWRISDALMETPCVVSHPMRCARSSDEWSITLCSRNDPMQSCVITS
jgi:hypothetical protein